MRRKFNLKSRIISALRRLFFYSPLRNECMRNAKVKDKYRCAVTNKLFAASEVCVDHIDAVVDPAKGWTNWEDFITRLFCPIEKLQVISKKEHKKKSKQEMKLRKKANVETK